MELRFNVWLEADGEVCLSVWRVALLEAVEATGSLTAAAERMGVHFRVAWRKVKEMEERLGVRLVLGQVGGAGGGGASLTPEARELVRRFRVMTDGLDEMIETRYREQFGAWTPKESHAER